METNKTKVFCYKRISTKKQSNEQQTLTIENYCKANGFTIDETITDIVSGGKDYKNRKIYGFMDSMIEGDILLVAELSRLTRSMSDLTKIINDEIKPRKLTLIVANIGLVIDCNNITAITEFQLQAIGFCSQLEKELICERTKRGVEAKLEQGVKFGMANPKYKGNKVEICRNANKASIKANKLKAENNENNKQFISICSIMNITANSDFKEIANELNRRGYKTSTGKEFTNANARVMWQRYSAQIREFKN